MKKQKTRQELEEWKGFWKTIAVLMMTSFVLLAVMSLYLVDKKSKLETQLSECQIEHLHNEIDFFDWGFCSGYSGGERVCYHQWQGDWYRCNQGTCEVIE